MADSLFFPLFVDLSGKRTAVIGGGNIAARRVKTLRAFSPRITVIAPEIHPDLLALEAAGDIHVRRKAFTPSVLDGADLVLAATDDKAVNEAVWRECKVRNIPVNVSTDRTKCDFYFPGIARRGNVVVGVTAGGTDHRTAKQVTERIRDILQGTIRDIPQETGAGERIERRRKPELSGTMDEQEGQTP